MSTFFTEGQHFGHKNIIKICNRPFGSLGEMESAIVRNWNSRVLDDKDTIYCLGDMFWTESAMRAILPRLNGKIIYTPSLEKSHERGMACWNKVFSIRPIQYTSTIEEIIIEGQRIILCHYSLREWPKKHYGSWHLHGHGHAPMDEPGKVLNASVDLHDFYPWDFQEIKEYMSKR